MDIKYKTLNKIISRVQKSITTAAAFKSIDPSADGSSTKAPSAPQTLISPKPNRRAGAAKHVN